MAGTIINDDISYFCPRLTTIVRDPLPFFILIILSSRFCSHYIDEKRRNCDTICNFKHKWNQNSLVSVVMIPLLLIFPGLKYLLCFFS